jgi:hypothetical protein
MKTQLHGADNRRGIVCIQLMIMTMTTTMMMMISEWLSVYINSVPCAHLLMFFAAVYDRLVSFTRFSLCIFINKWVKLQRNAHTFIFN